MDNRKETAEKIISALTNRSGFNDLWYNLDEDIQTEITDEIVNILPIQIVSKSDIVGSDVVITNCIHGHEFNDGEKVRVIERNRNGLLASNLKGDEWFYL